MDLIVDFPRSEGVALLERMRRRAETSNGGASWTVAYAPAHGSTLDSIAEHRVAVGDNEVAVTNDGGVHGVSWTPPTTLEPMTVACLSAADCFMTAFDVTPDAE